jgi:hypothetical protein
MDTKETTGGKMTNFTKEQALDILIKAEIEKEVKFYLNNPEYLDADIDASEDEIRKYLVAAYEEDKGTEPDWNEFNGRATEVVFEGETVDVKLVHETGGMDKGSNASMTFKIGDQFFTKEGYYASHYGYEWDGPFFESKPVERVITEYVPA